MLKGVQDWIFGSGRDKSAPSTGAGEPDLPLKQVWIEAIERRTSDRVDDVITAQDNPIAMRPVPKSGRGHWFDHR